MKNKAFLFLSIAIAAAIGLSSCTKDENLAPTIKTASLSSDNKTLTVTLSEGVFSKSDATGALDHSSFTVTSTGAMVYTYTVVHTAGSSTATINFEYTSDILGTEKFTVRPATASSIYDSEGKAMETTSTVESNLTTTVIDEAPKFSSAALSGDNKVITVTFSENVYSAADMTGALNNSSLSVVATENIDFTFAVTHVAGSPTATIDLTITSIVPGTATFTIKPASATSVYDNKGKAMDVAASVVTNAATQDLGIMGKWLSEGANVAPLLVTYFNVQKVEAEFKTDYTYIVNQFNIGNTTTTPDLVFTGTYVIEKSSVGNIWTIVCSQELPYTATASGIFEIKTSPEVLWYEVVQTSGTANVPPTPEAGFGSSNGGTLGVLNVQKFVRVQ